MHEDDVVLHGYTPGPLAGKPAVRTFSRFRFAGTHLGEFQGIPASGRPPDFLTMMIQIGAISAPA